jgi:hypothetical protein
MPGARAWRPACKTTGMVAIAAETQRVAQHIENAELAAARHDVEPLTHLQKLLRQLLLRALGTYRADGRFPINRDFAIQTPYFIDASGTRCAMAHLLELGGEHELVARIARERNNAYVRELADEPRLLEWLVAAGLTVEEAAAIQPSYCSPVTDCICGGDFSFVSYPVPARGVLEGVVQASGKARVERTYGDATGFTVGTEIALETSHAPGTRILAPIDAAADAPFASIALDAGGTYECSSQGVANAPPLSGEAFAEVVMANDCVAELRTVSSAWREEPDCEGGGPIDNDQSGGCSTATADALGVGVLLAVVTALARRVR